MRTTGIVVGTDGTETSDAAIDWAAREAHQRGLTLRIVHAFDWDWRESRFEIGNEHVDTARAQAEGIIAAAVERVRNIAPELTPQTFTLIGHAVPRLLESARGAQLLVLGRRGRGGFAGMLLGSTSQRVATHAPCPVVVVGGSPAADAPIAAGIDDSPNADLVLETVFNAAADQNCPVTVIRACPPVVPAWVTADPPNVEAAELARLDEQLAPWRSKFPDVRVEVVLTHDTPPAALVAASGKARLIIVGSHGHGLVTGTLVGSTSLQLLHHAACPVYIVRPLPQ
ncbi:universal stress protein [Actinoplanes teichomyceticus]|uniref:Nucleotide-binding universal stress UspA family protein n=1 Tax=Actinoplanes teichomyceticus TaxID=1867 RepID=A0A561VMS1_ACTTI|nr:universal stress protein [Actinoplanes teichomyceticus]TWG12919.1 nucleotide-binding universal stress UspA family protein [Actinoplanes teichomyceticus]GIF13672.1 universal stress protein [Actinoplanes teichomyceticus]